jgi:hypothetical protein
VEVFPFLIGENSSGESIENGGRKRLSCPGALGDRIPGEHAIDPWNMHNVGAYVHRHWEWDYLHSYRAAKWVLVMKSWKSWRKAASRENLGQ